MKLYLHPNVFKMHCKLTGWKWLNRPVLNLLGIVLHRRPPLLHLHHQALKQPLLILQGFPDLRHPEHRRNHHTHPSKSSIIYSVGIRGEKNNPPPQKKSIQFVYPGGTRHYAGDLRGSYCTETSRKRKAYEYLIGIRRAKGSVCRLG